MCKYDPYRTAVLLCLMNTKIARASSTMANTPIVHHTGDNRLVSATLHRRYKRFLADCEVNGVMEVVFCPNTGPMTGLLDHLPCPAKLSISDNPSRKYRYTLEWVQPDPNRPTWVGVHSARANHYVRTMLDMGILTPVLLGDTTSLTHVQAEVRYGEASRVDFVVHGEDGSCVYVEVKSVTMLVEGHAENKGGGEQEGGVVHKATAMFPDTVSTRAQQHARELTRLLTSDDDGATPPTTSTSPTATSPSQPPKKKKQKRSTTAPALPPRAQRRGVMLFVVQRDDADSVAPCRDKDPHYADLCAQAASAGVQLVAVAIRLDAERDMVEFVGVLPVIVG